MLKKLGTKFILLFTFVLTCVFVIMVIAVQLIAGNYVGGYIRDSIRLLQHDIDAGVTEVIDEAAYFYARIIKNENAALLNTLGSGRTQQTRLDALTELVNSAGMNKYYFVDVGWRDANGFFSVNGFTSPGDGVYEEAEDNKNSLVFGEYANGCDSIAIYMTSDITETEGIFVFYLLENTLSSAYTSLSSVSGYSFIMRSDGYVFSHDNKNYLGKTLIYDNLFDLTYENGYQFTQMDGTEKFVMVRELEDLNSHYDFDFYLVSVLDYEYYYGAFNRLTYIFLGVAAVIFVSGVVLAVVRARRISKPVEELNDSINEVIKTGTRSAKTAKEGDEIYQLEKNYDEMIDRIFKLMQKNKEDMEVQRKLELDTLQMQINPHFLYNTLDAVVWMAKIKKEPEIENLVLNLAKFFRLSLHKGDKYVTVSEEIEITRHYLEIERIRFPDKAETVFDVDESVCKYKTLKLVLQPIVENTMKYAFPDRRGNIAVRVRGDGEDIVYEIEDDGVGFEVPPNILEIKNDKKSPGSGYGLYNVNERVKLEYGGSYGLKVESSPGKGTKVTVRISKKI